MIRKYIRKSAAFAIAAIAALTAHDAASQQLADTTGYRKFRFGSYAEVVAAFKDYGINRFQADGASREHRNTISIPRFTLGIDYKFTPKWILGAEIEFEQAEPEWPSSLRTMKTANMRLK